MDPDLVSFISNYEWQWMNSWKSAAPVSWYSQTSATTQMTTTLTLMKSFIASRLFQYISAGWFVHLELMMSREIWENRQEFGLVFSYVYWQVGCVGILDSWYALLTGSTSPHLRMIWYVYWADSLRTFLDVLDSFHYACECDRDTVATYGCVSKKRNKIMHGISQLGWPF